MVRKRKIDSPLAKTAVTAEKREKFEMSKQRKSIITKVMICLDLFTIIVMKVNIEGLILLIPRIRVNLVRIVIVNLTEIRRSLRRNLKTTYGITQILIFIIQLNINLSIMDIRTLIISIHLGVDIIIIPIILIAVIIHRTIVTTFRIIPIITFLVVTRRSIRMSSFRCVMLMVIWLIRVIGNME